MKRKDGNYCVCGAPSKYTPGYTLNYYNTREEAKRGMAYYKGKHTCLWIQRKAENGEWRND